MPFPKCGTAWRSTVHHASSIETSPPPAPFHLACGFPSFPLLLSWALILLLLTFAPLAPSSPFRAAWLPWGSKVICAVSSPWGFFLLYAAWVRSRAERPSVSYTKVTAKSQGQAISCKYTTKTLKQISGSNKFLIAGDGKMKRMREPWDRTHWRDASNERGRVQSSARGSIEAAEVHRDDEMRGWEGEKKTQPNIKVEKAVRRFKTCRVPKICRAEAT